jgi:tetratricopeptide (TPR) repeat protein
MLKRKIPVVRQINWLSVVPQLTFMGLVILIYYLLNIKEPLVWGCLTYLILSYGSRAIFAKNHNKGMKLSRAQNFTEAIKYYEKSAEFFKNNKWIDQYRCITLFSAAKMSYREMALINIAFCYSQIGNGSKAVEFYKKALTEYPDSIMGKTALNMFDSAQDIETGKTAP